MANLNPALSQSLSLVLVRQCFYIGDDELRVLGQLLPQVICFGVGEIYVGDVKMAQVPLHLLLQAYQRQNDQSQPASPQAGDYHGDGLASASWKGQHYTKTSPHKA